MFFKIPVLLCVLYFFTVAWSYGLDKDQIDELVVLYQKHDKAQSSNIKNEAIFPHEDTVTYLEQVKYTGDIERFQKKKPKSKQKEFVVNNKTMPQFLIMLANNNKTSDCLLNEGLTSYEVNIFMEMFIIHDKRRDGVFGEKELDVLLNAQFIGGHKVIMMEKLAKKVPVNALLYLEAILKEKPRFHQHLNKAQIDKCHALYDSSKNHLDRKKQKALFETLNIVPDKYHYLLDMKSARPATHELQELLVFLSEYDNDFVKTEPFIAHVRQYVHDFSVYYDKDRDGLLNIQEFEEATKEISPEYNSETFLNKFFPNGTPICIAEYLNMRLSLDPKDRNMKIRGYTPFY
ncbi:uncharacterized protein LOC126844142 [Adelges cooleyi]|uniref:uncharacterized protein LOC126844142 n=1 Tax=Adelges cooleyi TaxID=133065 RepID=UPI00217FEA6F|nr:uncharacterized protein LOC126844142 [Adelges cooleyi]XP_050437989.1 uncharacterized protein LOC126844142 [Adelges cooleyi]XP_050437990.1 uncharacterized protein LOC126844142 [Adelges cooleyi]